jgi:hypothetical protein
MHIVCGKWQTLTTIAVFLLLALILSTGCTTPVPPQSPDSRPSFGAVSENGTSWMDMPVTDMKGECTLSIRKFSGKTVIVPVLSDSCSSCIVLLARQLDEIDRLPTLRKGEIVIIALDIDPPTGPGFVVSYHDTPAFTGYSARSPEEMTLDIFQRFGPFATDTAMVPVILVCPDGHDLLLPPGVKTAEMLDALIGKEC